MTNPIEIPAPRSMPKEDVDAIIAAENAEAYGLPPQSDSIEPKQRKVVTLMRGGKPVSFTTGGEAVPDKQTESA